MDNAALLSALKANLVGDHEVYFYGGHLSSFASWPFHAPMILQPREQSPRFWRTREHWFQAHKAAKIADTEYVEIAPSPRDAKRRGRHVLLRADWEDIKVNVMTHSIRLQVHTYGELRKLLLWTGDRVIHEDSPSDDIWGWRDIGKGPGQDLLGKCWMRVREELQA